MGLVFEDIYFNGFALSASFCDIFLSCNAVLHEVLSEFLFKIFFYKKKSNLSSKLFLRFGCFSLVNLMLHTLLSAHITSMLEICKDPKILHIVSS